MSDAAALPDVDEYDGMSIVDIATAIALWPEGSDDQARAIAAIQRRAPGMGHNRPPLAEALAEEIRPLLARRDQVLGAARSAVIVDDESAAKVTDLVALMRAFEHDVDVARKKRLQPYLDAQRAINARFAEVAEPVRAARQGQDGRGGLRAMLTAYADRKEKAAEAERQRLLEEQRRREAEAEAARRAADQAEAAGAPTVSHELDALRAADKAEAAARRAEAIRPEPIRSHMGQVSRRREIRFEIEHLDKTLAYLTAHYRANVEQFARTCVGSILRAMGVDAAERAQIPGVKISIEKGAANVRR